jgi:hypothetical protein
MMMEAVSSSVQTSVKVQQMAFEMIRREAGAGVASKSSAGPVGALILTVVVIIVLLLSQEDLRLGWRCR